MHQGTLYNAKRSIPRCFEKSLTRDYYRPPFFSKFRVVSVKLRPQATPLPTGFFS